MAAVLIQPPPKSAQSIKSNSLVQKHNNKKRLRKNKNKKPNSKLSPRSTPTSYTHLIAFDFDQTLSCCQVFYGTNRTALDVFGGKYRVQLIDKFLKYLKSQAAKNGYSYRIIIISYNFTSIISQRLKEVNLFHHFEKIYDRYAVNKHGGYKKGKGNLLRMLAKKWDVNFDENTLIIDDCDDVIWYSQCQTVHVSNFRGMYKYEMEQVCRKIKIDIPAFILPKNYS